MCLTGCVFAQCECCCTLLASIYLLPFYAANSSSKSVYQLNNYTALLSECAFERSRLDGFYRHTIGCPKSIQQDACQAFIRRFAGRARNANQTCQIQQQFMLIATRGNQEMRRLQEMLRTTETF